MEGESASPVFPRLAGQHAEDDGHCSALGLRPPAEQYPQTATLIGPAVPGRCHDQSASGQRLPDGHWL
jgi:hypothetical protein